MAEHPVIRVIGLAWFRKEDYPALLAIFEDAGKMPLSWEQWEKGAKKTEDRLIADGHTVERVYIDPDTFAGWCRKEDVRVAREGRHKFVALAVAEKYRTQ